MTYQEILSQNGYDFREYLENNHLKIPFSVSEGGNYGVLSDLLIASTNSITELTSLLALAKLEKRRHSASGDKAKHQEYIDKGEMIKDYLNACIYMNKTVSRLITVRQMELSEIEAFEYRKEK